MPSLAETRLRASRAVYTPPAVATAAPPASAPETPHQKVFRLIREGKFEDGAKDAKKLIDAGDVEGFFIHDGIKAEAAEEWYEDAIDAAAVVKKADWQSITPERAQAALRYNVNNRQINKAGLVERLRDLKDGRWEANGESIVIADNGAVNDGQHRLWACLLSGVTFTTAVSWGVSRDSRTTIDIGHKRSGGDRFHFAGVANSTNKAAVSSLAFSMFKGRKPTSGEVVDYYFDHQDLIDDAVSVIGSPRRGSPRTAMSVAAFFCMDKRGIDPEKVREFFRILKAGDKTKKRNCPVFTLYQAMYESDTAEQRKDISSNKWVLIFIKHIELFRIGASSAKLLSETVESINGRS